MGLFSRFAADTAEINGRDEEVGGNITHCAPSDNVWIRVNHCKIPFGWRFTVNVDIACVCFSE